MSNGDGITAESDHHVTTSIDMIAACEVVVDVVSAGMIFLNSYSNSCVNKLFRVRWDARCW